VPVNEKSQEAILIRKSVLTRRTLVKTAAGAAVALGMPAISYGQTDSIKIGHLMPRTGLLGPLGDYAVMGIELAADEINAAGGVDGRKIELMLEDSIDPQTASAKAERLIERDKVAMLIGEISSASGIAIGQVAKRTRTVFINTGCNSNALRGPDCNQYMFHIEAANSMYVQAIGAYLLKENQVKGRKLYSLTTDCAFGHDLQEVARVFMEKNGGQFVADELIPTSIADFSPFLLRIRRARPDIVISNLSGSQIVNFLKQYSKYALPFPVAGTAFDTAVAWGLGKGKFSGVWPLVWHHLVDTPTSKKYIQTFTRKYGKPPDNQSWADHFSLRIAAQSMAEIRSSDSIKLAEHLRKGATFDIGKAREGYFRADDNQMMMEMYAVRAKKAEAMKDEWDIYEALGTAPGPSEDLESIAPPKGACSMI